MTDTTEVYSPLTQQERRDVMKQDRKVREQQGQTTFKDFASAFASENSGGRFAKINPAVGLTNASAEAETARDSRPQAVRGRILRGSNK
jgi:hypothetical protein